MTEKELSYVKKIAEMKSFSGAARELFISQPTLSQCVSNIEKELGTPLFIRGSKGLLLTEAGESYYNTACEILRIYDDFTQELNEFGELKRGKIKLGIPTYLSFIILPKLLPGFHKMYPGISIELSERNSTELEELLLSSVLDFAIVHHIPNQNETYDRSMEFIKLSSEPFVICLPPGDEAGKYSTGIDLETGLPILDLGYIKDYPFLMVSRSNRLRMCIDYIVQQAKITPNVLLTTRNYETARRLVSAGMGATFIPWGYRKIFGEQVGVDYYAIPKDCKAKWDTSIVTVKGNYISRASRAFIEFAAEVYRENKLPEEAIERQERTETALCWGLGPLDVV